MSNYFLFRYRRQVRRLRRFGRAGNRGVRAYIDRHIWGKWHQLRLVRRFLLLWWLIVAVALIGTLKQVSWLGAANLVNLPVAGGTYTEAAVGTVKVLNPVLPEASAATDINRLVFSGLTRFDDHRQLQPDLATSWTVSADGRTYTFHLRSGVKWQDAVPFTSTDVAFTIAAIQNPDSRSPLASSWQGVTVATPDDHTVTFTLPNPLDSFIDSTTLGIVPRHLLEQIDPSQLREADFNHHPIGTGPFAIKTFAPAAGTVELVANQKYYLGRPKLDGFNFHFYDSPDAVLMAFAQRQVTSTGQITSDEVTAASQQHMLGQYQYPLPEEATLFFNTSDPLLGDTTLRSILSRALDRKAIARDATAGSAIALTQPLLPGQLGYSTKYAPASFSPSAAASALDAAGWVKTGDVRRKNGHDLTFQLVTVAGGDLEHAAGLVARQLQSLGIKVNVKAVEADELQQTYMRPRNFQLLLYGLNVGPDPDVYAFWHSSQAKDPGVNLSGYTSSAADAALEAGRIKTDPAVRAAKYDAFLKAWNADAPAAVLYEMSYDYGVATQAMGISGHPVVTPDDRFYNVQTWTVRRRFGQAH